MKKHAKRIFGAASAALLAVCSAAAVFPQLTASARYTTVNPLTEAPVTYKKGYIYAGDVNKDGALNRNDYDILQGIASSDMYPKDLPMYVMDLNGDGTVSQADAKMLGDFVSEDNLITLGDVYAPHTDGITGMDAQAILNYVRGTVPTDVNYRKQVSPFIDYIGDLFNRGDGLTEEDAMIIMRYIENIDKYGPLEPRMWVHEYEFDEEGRIIYNDNPKTRYAGNHLLSRSVTLDGTLGLNLYAHIDDDTESIIFDGPNGHMVLDSDDIAALPSSGEGFSKITKITYPIYSTQADRTAIIRFEKKGGLPSEISASSPFDTAVDYYKFSVRDYLDEYDYSRHDEKTNALVSALNNYCKAAENYFEGRGSTIEGIDGIDADTFKDYRCYFYDKLKGSRISLVLNSGTSLRIYYPEGTTVATAQFSTRNPVVTKEAVLGNSRYGSYIEIPNLPAHKLLSTYSVQADGSTANIVCPLNYAQRIMANTELDPDSSLVRLTKALYVYAKAAHDYTDANTTD